MLSKLQFCPFCAEYFTETDTLLNHIKQSHSDKISGKTVKVDTHNVGETARTIYICPHCNFAVDNNHSSPTTSIISHIDKHTSSIDPAARISFHISSNKELIQAYIKGKIRLKLFHCSLCTDLFGDSESLLRHLSFKHSDANAKVIPREIIRLIKNHVKDLPAKKTKLKYKPRYTF